MATRTIVMHYAVTAALVLVVAVFAHFHAIQVSERAVAEYKQEDINYWKSKLLPVYQATPNLIYEENPKTRDEVFDPLFRLMTPVIK